MAPHWAGDSGNRLGRCSALLRSKRLRLLFALGTLGLCLWQWSPPTFVIQKTTAFHPSYLWTNHSNHGSDHSSSSASSALRGPAGPRYMRLLVPGNEANQGLCKTLLSSSALGYPSPTIINWNKKFNDQHVLFGGSHIAKLDGVLDHLNSIDASHDEDLVLIVDGLDVWFQLRPSTLIDRYFRITREATETMQADIGRVAAANDMVSNVVFSSQKKCWPKEAAHSACYAVPESTLPEDAYGILTDTDIGDVDDPAHFFKWRPRWLNSGSCMGPVSAVRKLFERARQKKNYDQNFGSDQSIFAEIFGEQEFQRLVIKYNARNSFLKAKDWAAKKLGRPYSYQLIDDEPAGEKIVMSVESDDPFAWEFGITLDYRSEIMQATVFSEYDTAWLARADRERITALSTAKGIPVKAPRVGDLPEDVTTSLQPFYSPRHGHHGNGSFPVHKTWENVPLFTNLWTGVSPVAVHHNAHRGDLKGRIQRHWPEAWFQPHLRGLLNLRALSPQRAIAVTYTNASDPTQERAWYSHMTHSWLNEFSGARTAEGEFYPYGQLCGGQDIWEEIFRDGQGPWWDPRFREDPPVNDDSSTK